MSATATRPRVSTTDGPHTSSSLPYGSLPASGQASLFPEDQFSRHDLYFYFACLAAPRFTVGVREAQAIAVGTRLVGFASLLDDEDRASFAADLSAALASPDFAHRTMVDLADWGATVDAYEEPGFVSALLAERDQPTEPLLNPDVREASGR